MNYDKLKLIKHANRCDWSKRVAIWNRLAGVPVGLTRENKSVALDLINEELCETKEALDKYIVEDVAAVNEVADGIGDTIVTLLGLAYRLNIDMAPVMDAILLSNDTKLIGGVQRREDGKVLKGEHFKRPDIDGALAKGRSWL